MAQQFTLDLNLKAYPNTLTTDVDDDYTVKVETQSTSLTLDDIADATADRLGEEPTKVLGALKVAMEVMADAVASGFCISTPFCYAQPMASGVVMESELSLPVDRERVKVYASLRQGPVLAEALGIDPAQLLEGSGVAQGEDTKKAPALTEKDKRDVAKDVARIMESLEDGGELMFDGVPMSDEARASMAAAMRIGLEEARRRNKETYTPKKFKKE